MSVEIIHADALELDADFLGMFDAQITDFPYSPHVHDNAVSIGNGGRGVEDRDLGFPALSPELRAQGMFAAATVKRWSVVFSDWEGVHAWRMAAAEMGVEYVRAVPWIRWSQPQLSGDRPCTGSEAILFFHAMAIGARGGRKPLAKHWNGPGSLTHYAERAMRGRDKHPTEKPIDLLLSLVSHVSDPGEAVVDLTCGSGTTAIACRLLGRDCMAVEQREDWARAAAARVKSPLSARDFERAREWCMRTLDEAQTVPTPSAPDGSDVKTYERAQRRIADVERVMGNL